MPAVRAVLLFVTYWLFVTPVGLLLRTVHDPMRRRWDPRARTYWDSGT
ncbi:MAG TPA: hypothetical protein VGO86_03960 [Candidatus Dormibacteraeota bacterium]|jgi:hypothetical protein